jgi:signal transduction histidine kinase/CheY-like chemotaxis protein
VIGFAFAAFITPVWGETSAQTAKSGRLRKNIFVVSSYRIAEEGWGQDLVSGFDSVFKQDNCNIMHTDLELMQEQGIDTSEELSQYVLEVIKSAEVDMLIVIDDVAIEKFMEIQGDLPKDIPLILSGHISLTVPNLIPRDNIWTIKTPMEIRKTLKLGMSLLPETKNVVIIRDLSYEGTLVEDLIRQQVKRMVELPADKRMVENIDKLNFVYISGADTTTDGMYDKLEEIAKEPTFVLFQNWETETEYDDQNVYVKKISQIVGGNVFVFYDDTLNDVIGGYILNAMEFGVVTGELAKNILKKGNAEGYDPEHFTNAKLRLNWDVFVDRHFNFADLPKDAIFYTPHQTILESLDYRVISAVLLIFLGTAVTLVLTLYKQRRKLEMLNVKLTEATRAAQESEQAKGYFLATMSHELRTPLNAVIGYSELTQDPKLSHEERMHNLRNINFAANTLLSLINDILDLSKLEAEQLEIFESPISVQALAEEFAQIFKFSAKRKNIYLKLNVQQDIPTLMMDTLRLKQILMNIIGNSIKFTMTGGITVDISFESKDNISGKLFISVKDTGVGIDPQNLKKIFNPFKQDNNGRMRFRSGNEGTGLGLAIVKKLLGKMNGTVDVESTPNVGSTFKLIFTKVKVSSLPAENIENYKPKASKEKNPEDFTFDTTVLVVDDVSMNVKVLRNMLKKMGVNVLESLSGEEALKIMEETSPDLVMTDLWMPQMSGEELAKAMKINSRLSHIPVVVVTADAQLRDDEHVFDDIVFKPITMHGIFEILEAHVPSKMKDKQQS